MAAMGFPHVLVRLFLFFLCFSLGIQGEASLGGVRYQAHSRLPCSRKCEFRQSAPLNPRIFARLFLYSLELAQAGRHFCLGCIPVKDGCILIWGSWSVVIHQLDAVSSLRNVTKGDCIRHNSPLQRTRSGCFLLNLILREILFIGIPVIIAAVAG